jgi:hypothetical protein
VFRIYLVPLNFEIYPLPPLPSCSNYIAVLCPVYKVFVP